MPAKTRPYLYYDVAISICPHCYERVDGKILIQDGRVLLRRWCPTHGGTTAMISDDPAYWRKAREQWIKPPEMPLRYQTPMKWGCPYDCGLCPDHEQHSCLSIVEIADHCNLRCPICYAHSGPDRSEMHDFALVERMLDAVVESEGEPDVVQISGGEPTLHPRFFDILDAAKARPIRHLMLNTNGVRIATEPDFAKRLADYRPAFEVYLQFDSFEADALRRLRGSDLRRVRMQALENLQAAGIDTTLVVTVQKGVNDHELGRLVDFALAADNVRGITLQPVQHAGRTEGFNPSTDRLTLTEVRRRVLEQSSAFSADDIVPVPCHPDALAMAYALQLGDTTMPLTRLVPREVLLAGPRNTIAFEKEDPVKDHLTALFSTSHSPESSAGCLSDLLCCLPQVDVPAGWSYQNLFRLIIMQFMDAWDFDVRSVKKSCVHIVDPRTLHMVPFETYNLFYRDGLATERLAKLRAGRPARQ